MQTAAEQMEVEEEPCVLTPSPPHCSSKQHRRLRGKHAKDYITVPMQTWQPAEPCETAIIKELQSVIAMLETEESSLRANSATLEGKKVVLERLRERAKVLEESLQLARAALLSYIC